MRQFALRHSPPVGASISGVGAGERLKVPSVDSGALVHKAAARAASRDCIPSVLLL
jgi:hypothetical protein